ncbi:AAA family ATPase [Catenovulum sp. SM1970]|uniref:AAA family ATPase n=1 Tax=Marinifaba aquimaris TaxID=2741323 RepID=UPI001574224E|nr:AAA family ATPase [Marinifaba aquimaris]NTS77647.1 AAA family ATPase [Marinifaba aquimaris]
MKILTIRGENIASLADKFEIELDEGILAQSGLFAISGPTGAGKSSILDTLCLALFDNIPRVNKAKTLAATLSEGTQDALKTNDIRNIVTRGAISAFAEVEFIGCDGLTYLVNWSIRRARNSQTGRLLEPQITLSCLSGSPFDDNSLFSGKKRETQEKIVELIGLNYEQFRRAVLLAQGDFAAFLKADSKQRSDLLERMTGTEIYSDISKQAHTKAREIEQNIAQLTSQLKNDDLLDKEHLTELTNRFGETKQAKLAIEQVLGELKTWQHSYNQSVQEQAQLTELQDAFNQAKQALNSAEQDSEKLALYEQIQPHFHLIAQLEQNRTLLAKQTSESQSAHDKIKKCEVELSALAKTIQQEQQQQSQLTQVFAQAQPEIEQARQLDIEIEHLTEQQQTLQDQAEQEKTQLIEQETKLAQFNADKKALTDTLAQNQHWLEQRAGYQVLVLQYETLISAAKQYAALWLELNHTEKETERLTQLKAEQKHQNTQVKKQVEDLAQQQALMQSQYEQASSQYLEYCQQNGLDSASIEQMLESHSQQLNLLAELGRSQKSIEQIEGKVTAAKSELSQLKVALENQQQEKLTLEAEQQKQSAVVDAHLNAKNTASQVLDLTVLRDALKPDEACPLCGSTAHPYKDDAPSQKIVSELEQQYQHALALLETKTLAAQQSSQAYIQLETQINSQQQKYVDLQSDLQQASYDKEDIFSKGQIAIEVDEQSRLIWQNSQADELRAIYKQLQAQVNQLNEHKQQLNLLQEQQQLAQSNIADIQNKQISLQNQWQQRQAEFAQLDKNLDISAENVSNLNRQIAHLAEQVKVLPQSEAFLAHQLSSGAENDYFNWLEAEIGQYKQLSTLVETQRQEHEKLNLMCLEQEGAIKHFTAAHQQNIHQLSQFTQKLSDLTASRIKLLSGRMVNEFITKEQEKIDNIQSRCEQLIEQHQQLSQQLGNMEGQKQQIDEQLQQLNLTINSQRVNWQQVLSAIEVTEDIAIELVNLPKDWSVSIKEKLKVLSTEVQTADTKVSSVKQRLTSLNNQLMTDAGHLVQATEIKLGKANGLSFDVNQAENTQDAALSINAFNTQLNSRLAEVEQQVIDIEVKLKHDEKLRKEQESLTEQIASAQEKGAVFLQLKDLIGSADGHKFRSIAQHFTLQHLVAIANVHLRDLVPRYQLQVVPNANMELQVCDSDLADAVRNVESLSGGETFLVSLALALSLSSLSSNRVIVDSLFIDEGFGTLDPASLDMVIACLDSLQAQGKQIGVITHVQSMVERIGVQIKVTPKGGGHSSLNVINM